jgi:phosphate transport system permease protein
MEASAATGNLPAISPRRRRVDRGARWALGAAAVLALVPLLLVLFYLVGKGVGALGPSFFTSDPSTGFLGDVGGIRSAILGTLEIVGLAAVIAIPAGIGIAVYLIEYGKTGRIASLVRFFIDVMTGVPSIMFGLFVYITLVITKIGGQSFTGWKAAIALALLMLPIVSRSSEVVLHQVPDSLREAALALGAPRWKVIGRVVLPTALPGIITGSLLAIARGAGETAPLLFTTAFVAGTQANPNQAVSALPLLVFNDLKQPRAELVDAAWGAALTLVLLVLALSLIARLIQRRSSL